MSLGDFFGNNSPEDGKRREIEELRAKKAGLHDKLEELKEEKKLLEKQFIEKNEELEAAKGDSRKTIIGEMGLLDRQLRSLSTGRETILLQSIQNINGALAKTEETLAAMAKGVTEDQLDDIAVDAEEEFKKLKDADEVAKELEDVKYQAPEEKEADIAGRLEKLNEQGESAEEAGEEIPPAVADRLKELKDSDGTASGEEADGEKETESEEE